MTKTEYERRKKESYKCALIHVTEEGHETTYPMTLITNLQEEIQALRLEVAELKSVHTDTLNEIKEIVRKISEEV